MDSASVHLDNLLLNVVGAGHTTADMRVDPLVALLDDWRNEAQSAPHTRWPTTAVARKTIRKARRTRWLTNARRAVSSRRIPPLSTRD